MSRLDDYLHFLSFLHLLRYKSSAWTNKQTMRSNKMKDEMDKNTERHLNDSKGVATRMCCGNEPTKLFRHFCFILSQPLQLISCRQFTFNQFNPVKLNHSAHWNAKCLSKMRCIAIWLHRCVCADLMCVYSALYSSTESPWNRMRHLPSMPLHELIIKRLQQSNWLVLHKLFYLLEEAEREGGEGGRKNTK